jgi:hypothetical protein
MGQDSCARFAVVATIYFLGMLPPAFAMDRQAGGTTEAAAAPQIAGFDSQRDLGTGPSPTRFDYMVLASFADAANVLSLSAYHFRSEMSFSNGPLTGWQPVDFKVIASRPIREGGLP